jgi:amino-acid N-acetyltransferase
VISIRQALPEDQATLRKMIFAARLDPTTIHWQNFVVAVETETEKIVGCAQMKPYKDCREFGSLVVAPTYRNRGIAAMLLHELVDKEKNDVYLICRNEMRSYYSRFNFVEVPYDQSPRTLKLKIRLSRFFPGANVICMIRAKSHLSV